MFLKPVVVVIDVRSWFQLFLTSGQSQASEKALVLWSVHGARPGRRGPAVPSDHGGPVVCAHGQTPLKTLYVAFLRTLTFTGEETS